ncbi:YbaB/EbfC family nucleoid-associated protein [Nocardia puris]|uniref:YbaB/EbfC family nucleoid-associated protein n=1 Tax=Nocardia puris TaxID=208602 RepID=UPI0008317DBD|nr:YbaB/EbfC family nucleoid-associated protein [Nocardia puris]
MLPRAGLGPLLPVRQDQAVLEWPQAGAASVEAPLVSYVPLRLAGGPRPYNRDNDGVTSCTPPPRIRVSTPSVSSSAQAVAAIRGRADKHGVTVEVDARGDITDLRISPAAMPTSNTQLSTAITDTYRDARSEATAKVNRALRSADPRLRGH